MNGIEKVERAFDICASAIDDINSAYVQNCNEMSEDEIAKRGEDDIKYEIACVQAVEAAFSYGVVTCSAVVSHLLKAGEMTEGDEKFDEFVIGNKIMASIIAVLGMLREGVAMKSLDAYMGKAKEKAESIEEMSKMMDVVLLGNVLSKVKKGEDALEGLSEGENEVKSAILEALTKAKGNGGGNGGE